MTTSTNNPQRFALAKMKAQLDPQGQAHYQLAADELMLDCQSWIGSRVTMQAHGHIECVHCGRKSRKSFHQGYCYPCFRSLAACDRCVMSPHLCHFHKGTCREPEWGQKHCMEPMHVVYLSLTSHLKVGLTRMEQCPTRWIDQGAVAAMPLVHTKNRYLAGLVEHACSAHYSDRTSWQKMLKGNPEPCDWSQIWQEAVGHVQTHMTHLCQTHGDDALTWVDPQVVEIQYPVSVYPDKVTSISLDKTPTWSAKLLGIKGQYWITDGGVFNVRKHSGYVVDLSLE